MNQTAINRLLLIGAILISSIIGIQAFWLFQNWDFREDEFHQKVHISLRKVAVSLSEMTNHDIPENGLIKKVSSNYYVVNINDYINAEVLEYYLQKEFLLQDLTTNFEYAIYDCQSDEMVYGDYCLYDESKETNIDLKEIPKYENQDFLYYFGVRFPHKSAFILGNINTATIFSIITLLALLFFSYSIYIIFRQKRYSELQYDFINNMTHELKTPISSIKISSDVLIQEKKIANDPRLKKYIHIISEQNDRLNKLVGRVLNLAKLEAENFTLNLEKKNLQSMLKNITDHWAMVLETTGGLITFDNRTNKDEAIEIICDETHLTTSLNTIIDNANKYSRKSAKISVQLLQDPLTISIKDQGIGIPPEHISKVFNKFYRVPHGNIHDVKGFGLGLHYCYSIVQAHGWKMDITSEENKETIVNIYLES
jgi:two-component system phosphate regulon sensor histidine kinase PhoR